MRKFIQWLGGWMPEVWTVLLIIIITFGAFGMAFIMVEWVFKLLGVL